MEFIKQNLKDVEEKICNACKRAGRDRSEVTLIAVSKTKPVEMLEACIENGITVFGENKVQELCGKYEVLPENLHWHMIGHLQRNKVKYITDKAELIHSVDSLRLAEAISEDAVKKGVNANILIEVNVAQEDSKFGLKTEDTEELIRQISSLPNIFVKGLFAALFALCFVLIVQYLKKKKEIKFRTTQKKEAAE